MESFLFERKFPLWDLWLTPFGPIVDHSSESQFGLGLKPALDLDTRSASLWSQRQREEDRLGGPSPSSLL